MIYKQYGWRDGSRIKADAAAVGKEIEGIGREVTPAALLKAAENEKTELHNCFTWDDTEAAQEYRIGQARDVLAALIYVEEKEDEDGEPMQTKYRCYENVRYVDKEGGTSRAYVPIAHALREESLKVQVFARLIAMVKEAEDTMSQYEELSDRIGPARKKAREAREILQAK